MEACPPRVLPNGELQAVEQHVPELLCGTDVERPLRLAVNVLGDAVQILLYFFQKTGERFSVELDARAFHIRKHRDERQPSVFMRSTRCAPDSRLSSWSVMVRARPGLAAESPSAVPQRADSLGQP